MTVERITKTFNDCKQQGRAALVTFLTAGDPDAATTLALIRACADAGADVVELGMPFSDPMADGPAIQAASRRALKGGQTMASTLQIVKDFRQTHADTPLILMGYLNPVEQYGTERLMQDAAQAGADGLIIVDVPLEERDGLAGAARANGLAIIPLIAPTTDEKRMAAVLADCEGFAYGISITGITGTRAPDLTKVREMVAAQRRVSELPFVIGFGVRTPEQAAALAREADGVVVGSALVEALQETLDAQGRATEHTIAALASRVAELAGAMKSVPFVSQSKTISL